jgi:hypothetical protein
LWRLFRADDVIEDDLDRPRFEQIGEAFEDDRHKGYGEYGPMGPQQIIEE